MRPRSAAATSDRSDVVESKPSTGVKVVGHRVGARAVRVFGPDATVWGLGDDAVVKVVLEDPQALVWLEPPPGVDPRVVLALFRLHGGPVKLIRPQATDQAIAEEIVATPAPRAATFRATALAMVAEADVGEEDRQRLAAVVDQALSAEGI